MKTAMQELVERLLAMEMDGRIQIHKSAEAQIMFDNDIKELLEKEKEQIKTAFESGWNWNFNAEKYYNETYNPAPYQHKANEFKDNDRIEINPITGDVKIITNEEN